MKSAPQSGRKLLLPLSLIPLIATVSAAPGKDPKSAPKAVPAAEVQEEAAAPAEVIIPESGLTPATPAPAPIEGQPQNATAAQIEVRFPAPMIPAAQVNQEVDAAQILEIKPALAGKFRWRSTQSGTLTLSALPQLGKSYTFQARALKDAAGRATPRGEAVTVQAPPLTITHYTPRWFGDTNATRTPSVTLFFNDAVTAANLAQAAYFTDKNRQRVSVSALSPLFSEVQVPATTRTGTWAEQHSPAAPVKPDQLITSAVTVKPSSPLPVGQEWTLVVPAGVGSSGGLPQNFSINVGSVAAFGVASMEAEPILDGDRELHVWFSKKVAELPPAELAKSIRVTPRPKGAKMALNGNAVTFTGGFEVGQKYTVSVAAGLPSLDGLALAEGVTKELVFKAHEPHVSLPAFSNAQWIGGRGEIEFATANLQSAQLRVKKIGAAGAPFALSGYQIYTNDPSREDGGNTRVPFEALPGKTVFDKEFPTAVDLDRSERFKFTWDEVGGGKRAPGLYFVSVEGAPKEAVENSSRLGSQALVTLTDIGLAWKYTSTDALVFAFSHSTGQPLPGVKLVTVTEEGDSVQEGRTAENGLGTMKLEKAKWLIATLGEDMHPVKFDGNMASFDMWSFDLPYTSRDEAKSWREVSFFSDRPVYQPGETVFFKAIQREHSATGLSIPANSKGMLRLFDPQNRLVTKREITFSATGTIADNLRLPERAVGYYRLSLDLRPPQKEKPADAAANSEEEGEGEEDGEAEEGSHGQMVFDHSLLVQEYTPNSFRINFDAANVKREGDNADIPVRAAYLMGKALSEAELKWTSEVAMQEFSPSQFSDYRFCHARSYYVWDGQEYRSLDEEAWRSPLMTGEATVKLSAKGEAMITAKMPAGFGVPGPKTLTVSAEITDINQQTISDTFTRTEHPSQWYLGVRRARGAMRVGQEMPLDVVAVQPDGKRWAAPVEAKLLVEHLTWNAVREATAGGGTNVRNELALAKVSESDVTISPEPGKERATVFKPTAAGTHNLTFTARDANGAEVRTVISVDVFGADDMTWQQDDGIKIELVADKDSYQPGDTAQIIVKSPFKGTALVTVEREKVLQSSVQPLDAGGVIRLPVTEDWAPNVFVSVVHIRGGAEDTREHKAPDYRAGFCQLKVESRKHRLAVEVKPLKADVRPGEDIDLIATVKDAQGRPVANAELALWASDEGILTLLPWEAPQPYDTFHYDQSLMVTTGTSLTRLLPENPEELDFSNKGFVIGGGGNEGGAMIPLRKNFQATAYWNGTLQTGVDGTVKVKFPAPDNLTAFHLVAVASEGVSRFGTGEGKVTVSKPLMLEPALPRFANVGDDITLVAVLHNNTEKAGEVKVELTSDERLQQLDDTGKPVAEKTRVKTVTLAAQQTKSVAFPVKFTADGPTTLAWKATGADAELTDAVESKFSVGFAEPELRELLFVTLTDAGNAQNLLAKVRPEVLEGRGDVRVTVSNSRLIEASEAISQLLQYPYGCAEQTSSALMPWLAVKKLRDIMPDLDKTDEEIARAVKRGVDRLLSMQTYDGGLAYWPGGAEENVWASSHALIVLSAAKKEGYDVPEERLGALTKWLAGEMRSEEKEETDYTEWLGLERCYACYALASAGAPEPAYHSVLFAKRSMIPPAGRALLALSMAVSKGDAAQAKELLAMPASDNSAWWLGEESTAAIRAMAFYELGDAAADGEMSRLFAARSPRGDWRHTFNNAWVLNAAMREQVTSGWKGDAPVVLQFAGAQPVSVGLPQKVASDSRAFPRAAGTQKPALTATMPAGQKLFARVEVTGRAAPGTETAARASGFAVSRTWQEVAPNGNLSAPDNLEIGDLVLVTLGIEAADSADYVVVDDPLPSTMEGVNPDFTSMAGGKAAQAVERAWSSDFTEIRRDRMLFFRDYLADAGKFRVQYLARVVAEGNVAVPPTRVEQMYDPATFGHSDSARVITRRPAPDDVAGK